MEHDELAIVKWLRRQTSQPLPPSVPVGIGDDMAVVRGPGGLFLLASDMLLDGVHFDRAKDPLPLIGRKAVACSLSDCAAMAVKPLSCTVSLALPRDMDLPSVKKLYGGMFAIASAFDLAIVGGDTTRWDQPLAIDVAITAVPIAGVAPLRRSGAQVGDGVYVTGALGGSRLGRHLTFTPRVHEARKLAESLGARLHAMMDLSDGLSLDLWRMCQASGTGARLSRRRIEPVISDDARRLAASDHRSPLDHALSDGEDFELLFTASGRLGSPEVPVHRIGEVVEHGIVIVSDQGREEPLEPRGFVH